MFKMGLIKEAASDFGSLIRPGQKEPWVFFNYATCLIQLGKPLEPSPPNYTKANESNSPLTLKLRRAALKKVHECFGEVLGDASFLQEGALIHQGTKNFVQAISNCNSAIKYAGADKELILDSLSLKGICLYRLGHLIEAVRILHLARR